MRNYNTDIPKSAKKKNIFRESLTHMVKSLVYGGFDGIIGTFAIIAGAYVSKMELWVVIAIGMAGIIGAAISMCMGDFISTKSMIEY